MFCFRRDGEEAHPWYNEREAAINKVTLVILMFILVIIIIVVFIIIYVDANKISYNNSRVYFIAPFRQLLYLTCTPVAPKICNCKPIGNGYKSVHYYIFLSILIVTKFWSFGRDACIDFNIDSINTRLEDSVNLDVLFLTMWVLGCLFCNTPAISCVLQPPSNDWTTDNLTNINDCYTLTIDESKRTNDISSLRSQ